MPRILCYGSRKWDNPQLIFEVLAELPDDSVIIHGMEPGADQYIKDAAIRLELPRIEIDTNRPRFEPSTLARPSRTDEMMDEHPQLVIVFDKQAAKSSSASQILMEAKARNIPVQLVS